MKRAMFITIPLLVALALVVSVTAAVLGFPVAAQQELDSYLQHIEPSAKVDVIARAARTWNFGQESNYPAFGDNWFFRTDARYTAATKVLETPVWQKHFYYNSKTPLNGRTLLPFPPQELWCVLLNGENKDRVLFLAEYHQEPYYTEWVIHQGPQEPFSPELLDTLSAIGCDLELTE